MRRAFARKPDEATSSRAEDGFGNPFFAEMGFNEEPDLWLCLANGGGDGFPVDKIAKLGNEVLSEKMGIWNSPRSFLANVSCFADELEVREFARFREGELFG